MTIIQRIEAQGCGCDAPEELATLISIDKALGRIARHAMPIEATEPVSLFEATGRILAEPVRAAAMSPAFDNAAMDGYAVDTGAFAGDGPWTFSIASRIPAGAAAVSAVGGNRVARVFTGAPVPQGADAVIRQEDACGAGSNVVFDKRPECGSNIRRAGGDMRVGQVIVDTGTCLGPREIAACAGAGAGTVQVRRPLRVGLLVTGNEVRTAGACREDAEIWDVNTPMLCAALRGPRIDLVQIARVADQCDALEQSLAELAGRVDLIVTTGGVSAGEEDHVRPALRALGADIHFSGVAIKPGKPVSYGCVGQSYWLGLPGNPLAALVTWQIFGAELTRRLTGQRVCRTTGRHVVIAHSIRRKPGRCELRPASVIGFDSQGREVVGFEDATHSGRVGRLPISDGLILLPADTDHLPAGALVEFRPFRDC